MFVVFILTKEIEISVGGAVPETTVTVPLRYGDGMIGALPVFETLEQAEAYSEGKYQIEEIQAVYPI